MKKTFFGGKVQLEVTGGPVEVHIEGIKHRKLFSTTDPDGNQPGWQMAQSAVTGGARSGEFPTIPDLTDTGIAGRLARAGLRIGGGWDTRWLTGYRSVRGTNTKFDETRRQLTIDVVVEEK